MADNPTNGAQSARVLQATGMISAQAGCDVAAAFELLQERARATDQSLEHTALDVIDGIIRFDE